METIPGHDEWKTRLEHGITDIAIRHLENTLDDCPFCGRLPFFEDSAHEYDIFVTCHCGVRMTGRDYSDAADRWNTRYQPVARHVLREGVREPWPGA